MSTIRSYKIQNRIWLFGFIITQISLILVALLINPYRLFPVSVTIPKLNDIKPRLYDNQRFTKIFDISRIKPKTILLGSSRVLWGIDPKNHLLQQGDYQPVYNAGIIGPPLYEVKRYFDHALKVQPHLKRVILGIDFFELNSKFDGRTFLMEDDFGKSATELLYQHPSLILDLKAIFETLQYSFFHKEVKMLRDDGRLTPAPIEARELYKDFFTLHKNKFSSNTVAIIPAKLTQKPAQRGRDDLYSPFSISKDSMKALQYIVDTCKQRNIELFIFMTPTYTSTKSGELMVLQQKGILKDYQIFLKKLANIHPFWTFVGKNEINTNKDNYIDESHFTFEIGHKIIEKMLQPQHNTTLDFGVYITTHNINRYLKSLEKLHGFNTAQTTGKRKKNIKA